MGVVFLRGEIFLLKTDHKIILLQIHVMARTTTGLSHESFKTSARSDNSVNWKLYYFNDIKF